MPRLKKRSTAPAERAAPWLAERLKAVRLRLGLSQAELAERLGIADRVAITHIERRMQDRSLQWCYDAARKLGISPAELDPRLADTLDPPEPPTPKLAAVAKGRPPGRPSRKREPEPEPPPEPEPEPTPKVFLLP